MPSSADIVRSWAANLAPAAPPVKAAGKHFSDAADRPKFGACNNQVRERGKMAPILSKEEARTFYDRLGARQDSQAFYEDPASAVLIAHAAFDKAEAVFEFGCGTGRFAERLLESHLPARCTFRALDISPTMVGLAGARLGRWGGRAEVVLTDGSVALEAADDGTDRFVSNYVLDLLGDADIRALLAEAHRILRPRGLLCLAGLTHGTTPVSALVSRAWTGVHAVCPKLLGGCRPIEIRDALSAEAWRMRHHAVIRRLGISSQVVVVMAG